MSAIGCAKWTAVLTERGGDNVIDEIPFASLRFGGKVDDSSTGSITVASAGVEPKRRKIGSQLLNLAEPWEHEVAIYEDSRIAFVGPVVGVEAPEEGGTITIRNLYHWMQKRWIDIDFLVSDDAALAWKRIFEQAMSVDTSPNVEVLAKPVGGDKVVRRFVGREFTRAADPLAELSRTLVDFVVLGRQIVVGGDDIFDISVPGPGTPLLLHNEGVSSAPVTKDGELVVTDAAVFGEAISKGNSNRIFGRASSSTDRYGVVQQSFAELGIKDKESANANASARVRQSLPSPRRVQAVLTPQAAFELKDVIPGRRVDNRVTNKSSIDALGMMRLREYTVEVTEGENASQTVTLELIPLGEVETEA